MEVLLKWLACMFDADVNGRKNEESVSRVLRSLSRVTTRNWVEEERMKVGEMPILTVKRLTS